MREPKRSPLCILSSGLGVALAWSSGGARGMIRVCKRFVASFKVRDVLACLLTLLTTCLPGMEAGMGRAVCENWLRSEACRAWAAWAACLEWLACQLRSEAQLLLKSVDTFQTSWPGGMGGFPFDFGGPDLGVLSVLVTLRHGRHGWHGHGKGCRQKQAAA